MKNDCPNSNFFPADFQWGVATSAFQIEGGCDADGRTPCIWEAFAAKTGNTWNGHHASVSADHYHRWHEDVALMGELGVRTYRFSMSWSRLLPEGTGRINTKGLDFYDRLVDALLERHIAPALTLYHWDMPLCLQRRGGWMNREVSDWMAEFASLLCSHFSDRIKIWITLNEPQCFIAMSYKEGTHAPGLKLGMGEVLHAAHNALLAHGKCVQVIRAQAKTLPQIGLSTVGVGYYPEDPDNPADIEAARTRTFLTSETFVWTNSWWTDAVYLGAYPNDALERYGHCLPEIRTGDMALISQPLDFCGFNHYFGEAVRANEQGNPIVLPPPMGCELTTYNWPITPQSIYWFSRFMHERYRLPLFIAENGTASGDWVALDGEVRDPSRVDFVQRNLLQINRLWAENIPVLGYMYWSLLDNYEWQEGFRIRFGLVHVDFQTLRRTPKNSFHWYQSVIASGGNCLFPVPVPAPREGMCPTTGR